MKKTLAILGLLATLTALIPMSAEASGRHHRGFHRGGRVFVGVGIGFPCCGFYPWPYYYPSYYPTYYPAPDVYTAPAATYTAPAATYTQQAPQVDREVVFPEGRYILHGDGVTTAYKWVWVPNPPAPPTAPPTATPEPR
jgi:hypothetical protein